MHIRTAEPHEASLLAAVAWTAKASWGYSAAQLEAWRESLTPSSESLSERPTFVAETCGNVVGFTQVNLGSSPIELEHMWVLPEAKGRGVGCALLASVVAHLVAIGQKELHIDSDPNAEAFYIRCGASRVGEVAAPIPGDPGRVRPQLRLTITQPNLIIERTASSGLRPLPAAAHGRR